MNSAMPCDPKQSWHRREKQIPSSPHLVKQIHGIGTWNRNVMSDWSHPGRLGEIWIWHGGEERILSELVQFSEFVVFVSHCLSSYVITLHVVSNLYSSVDENLQPLCSWFCNKELILFIWVLSHLSLHFTLQLQHTKYEFCVW